jgi:hypothetical protein
MVNEQSLISLIASKIFIIPDQSEPVFRSPPPKESFKEIKHSNIPSRTSRSRKSVSSRTGSSRSSSIVTNNTHEIGRDSKFFF